MDRKEGDGPTCNPGRYDWRYVMFLALQKDPQDEPKARPGEASEPEPSPQEIQP